MNYKPDAMRRLEIFHPYALERMQRIAVPNGRFVHYTDAAAAASILANKEVWMRNTACMNDYSY